MKILLCSHLFHPSVGGTEEVGLILAREFVAVGHQVKVATATAGDGQDAFPFEIERRPGPFRLLGLVSWSDVVLQNNISLRTAWPLLMVSRPMVIAHHTWLTRVDGRTGWREKLKRYVARKASNIAVSRAVADHLKLPAEVIGNPYQDQLFRRDEANTRNLEVVYLGRLVPDKGVDLLLEALVRLKALELRPRLTIIGDGPELEKLRQEADRLSLEAQVDFAGARRGAELVALLNRHRVLVVPSRWQEPFGLVALEGIACGCVVVAAHTGGLPEAVGACGVTFPGGNVEMLANRLADMLSPTAHLESYRAAAPAHLAKHSAKSVAAEYLRVLEGRIAL